MSWQPCPDPIFGDARSAEHIAAIVVPRLSEVGGLQVHRALPASGHGMVGPFIFLDQMGPTELLAGRGLDVAPHPHINLATVTYLFEGELLHRDSLGSEQIIRPGDVNWMSAGRGIVHSERSTQRVRKTPGASLFGLQTWVALPAGQEESEPEFTHVEKSALPLLQDEGVTARLVAGQAWGERSPVRTPSDTLYADIHLQPGARFPIDASHEELAIFIAHGSIHLDGQDHTAGRLILLRPGACFTLNNSGPEAARLILIGGETMDGPRHIWWNFVSSRPDRIEQAREAWKSGRFDAVPGEGADFTPAPPMHGRPRSIPAGKQEGPS